MKLDAVSIAIIALLLAVVYGFYAYWRAARHCRKRTDEMRRHVEHQDWRIRDME